MSDALEIEKQIDLTKTLLTVFTDWGLGASDQIALLGLPQETKARALGRFRAGMEVPAGAQFLQRAHYILAISNAINSLFPHNITAANYWITTRSENFGNRSPLDVMLTHDLEGMEYILNLLNGENQWGASPASDDLD